MNKIEKLEAGRYIYRGVRIFKNGYEGFSYHYSTRTDRYCRSDFSYPVALKYIASKIDKDIEGNGGVVDHAGHIVHDTRTAENAGA